MKSILPQIFSLKKITFLLMVISIMFGSSFNAHSQVVSTFDDLTLAADTFWNGSDLTKEFKSGKALFLNSYSTSGGYESWSGFAYSNKKDIARGIYQNQYSAYTGGGYNSNNYAVVNGSGARIILDEDAKTQPLKGFYITNTTYAALTIKNGNQFSKKFGGIIGNDADWFKVSVFGFTQGKSTSDSIEIYLADYRFSDNTEDYVLNSWKWIDLSKLGIVDSIGFEFASSDVGEWGMNTPAYFAMDNFNSENPLTSSIERISSNSISIFPNPAVDNLFLTLNSASNENSLITITDLAGKIVYNNSNVLQGRISISVSQLPTGMYHLNVFQKDKADHFQFLKN